MTTSLDPVEFMERRFQESAANVVHDLRDLADRVERVAKIQDPISLLATKVPITTATA